MASFECHTSSWPFCRVSEPHEHGLMVVEYFSENSTIQEFQQLWRTRFVELMKPKHLGDYWHIDYNHLDYLWVKPTDGMEESKQSEGSRSTTDSPSDME